MEPNILFVAGLILLGAFLIYRNWGHNIETIIAIIGIFIVIPVLITIGFIVYLGPIFTIFSEDFRPALIPSLILFALGVWAFKWAFKKGLLK